MNATFLLTLGQVGLLVCAAPLFASAVSPVPHLDPGPMLGHVGSDEMRVWLRATGPCVPAVRIGEREDLSDAQVVAGGSLVSETDFAGTLVVTNLKPATRYFYPRRSRRLFQVQLRRH